MKYLAPGHKACRLRRLAVQGYPAAAPPHWFGRQMQGRVGRYWELKCALRYLAGAGRGGFHRRQCRRWLPHHRGKCAAGYLRWLGRRAARARLAPTGWRGVRRQ
jgi:hypothetical protein